MKLLLNLKKTIIRLNSNEEWKKLHTPKKKQSFPLTNHVNVTLNEITVATKIDQKIPRLRTRNNPEI